MYVSVILYSKEEERGRVALSHQSLQASALVSPAGRTV